MCFLSYSYLFHGFSTTSVLQLGCLLNTGIKHLKSVKSMQNNVILNQKLLLKILCCNRILRLITTKFLLIHLYAALMPSEYFSARECSSLFASPVAFLASVSSFLPFSLIPCCKSGCVRLPKSLGVGLSVQEAASRLQRDGFNRLSDPKSDLARKLFNYFFGGCGMILWPAAILSCLSWKPLGGPFFSPLFLSLS